MSFTNSKLATVVRISPFRNSPRNQPITKITLHHMAGVLSLEQFGNIVTSPGRDMSANYAVDKDARVGLFCPESDRSWCSSSPWNDNRAITIEISNSAYGDASGWPVSDKVMAKVIDLCVDICKRNGIKKMTYTGDRNGSLTFHCFFSFTSCPGPYIKARAQEICDKINARLGSSSSNGNTSTSSANFKTGDLVSINSNGVYYNGSSIPSWVKEEKWFISSISGDRAVLGMNESKNRNIQSPISTKYLTKSGGSGFKSYTKSLKSTDTLYTSPGGNTKGTIGTSGIFTIVEEQTVNGVKYGKLKSGAGWVKLTTSSTDNVIRVGDTVKVLNNVQYNGEPFKVYCSSYKVLEVKGERIVISSDGKNTTCAINSKNLKKL